MAVADGVAQRLREELRPHESRQSVIERLWSNPRTPRATSQSLAAQNEHSVGLRYSDEDEPFRARLWAWLAEAVRAHRPSWVSS